MPERSEGIPFFFLALDMGVPRFQLLFSFGPKKLCNVDETQNGRTYHQARQYVVVYFLMAPFEEVVYLVTK